MSIAVGRADSAPHLRWLVLALALVFVGIYFQYVSKLQHSESGIRSAFLRWRVQLEDLNEGVNVWDKYAYPNPPIMAIILRPFLALPPLIGSTLWFGVKATLAILAVLAVFSLLDDPRRPFPLWGKIVAIGTSLRPMEGDLVHGNVNLFVLFVVVMALYSFCHRREYLAGLLLGLGIACKLTPALFLAYFLWKRSWKMLGGAVVGLILFVLMVPAAAFGWNRNLEYLHSWHHQMIAPYADGEVTSEHKNQSLPGLLHRMLSDEPSFSDYVGLQKVVRERHNLVSLDRDIVQGIVALCMLAFAGLALWRCRTPIDPRPDWQLMAEFGVVVLGTLLFCERTWKHHCVTLLIPFSVAVYGLSSAWVSRRVRWLLGITMGLAFLLMLTTTSGHLDLQAEAQSRGGKIAQVYGAYIWVFLLMTASMLVVPGCGVDSCSEQDTIAGEQSS